MQSKIHTTKFRTEKYDKYDEAKPVADYAFRLFISNSIARWP